MENNQFEDMIEFAKKICQTTIIGNNLSFLYENITPEFREKLTIAEIGRRLATMEGEHGTFTKVGDATTPNPSTKDEGFYIFDVSVFINKNEWFATFSMNMDHKINGLEFSRHPFYIAASYFNPHKVLIQDLSETPLIRYVKPALRNSSTLPMAILVHTAVSLDVDGHLGIRYPFRDFEYIAQKKVGFIKPDYRNFSSNDPIVDMAKLCINLTSELPETSSIFLILHGFASIFLPQILSSSPHPIAGAVLVNPAWEAIPGSGLQNMTPEKVPQNLPMLIIGCGRDQVMIPDHWKMWKDTAKNGDSKWVELADHFLMDADIIPTAENDLYMKVEKHVNEDALDLINRWILEHSPSQEN
ncbi:hypothetical protein TVAG_065330 [Trichomonas vaginalis G3]|uniref:Uncharacterized protein n=1 Tax=Trichomonas vaginalis (strain ATCC PRA-98 / G3) TaxID=412133 RepID=A2FUW6_TRIV3|nr:alpha/beta-hydrolases family [Trichomonas vaginalis G3]EAX91317.1 hypothetical protein TVAG_065330 [Trichomonas vaginalis G3]KAI5492996.1 alpha/beta-hydrolases family [Trichomonas vaginalis G3]|eukprot:XP_001304247.1 hypothetical protein [Trichomonas vaginalis G3]